MSMNQRQRWLILGTLLVGTVLAGVLIDDEPASDKPAKTAAKSAAKRNAPAADNGNDARRDTRDSRRLASVEAPAPAGDTPGHAPSPEEEGKDTESKEPSDPFRSRSWYVPPPPPPPAKPKAPPLPFKYLGSVIDDAQTIVFLNQQGNNLIVRTGETIGGNYLVEEIANGQMILVYKPLNERQVLSIAAPR